MAKIFFKQLDILGTTMGTEAEFREMLGLIARHRIQPVVDRVLPMREAAEASRLLESSEQMGKILLDCT